MSCQAFAGPRPQATLLWQMTPAKVWFLLRMMNRQMYFAVGSLAVGSAESPLTPITKAPASTKSSYASRKSESEPDRLDNRLVSLTILLERRGSEGEKWVLISSQGRPVDGPDPASRGTGSRPRGGGAIPTRHLARRSGAQPSDRGMAIGLADATLGGFAVYDLLS